MKKIKFLWQKITVYQKGLLVVFLTWGAYFSFLFPRLLFRSAEGIWAGAINVWGDWPAHFALAMPFAYGKMSDWLTYHPLLLDHKLTYPFLVDAFSGLLIRFGLEETTAFWLPSLFLVLFLLGVLYKFVFPYCRSIGRSFLVITIFLASGGLGFIFFLQDFGENYRAIFFPPREYTHWEEKGIYWINTVNAELIPQRAFPLGMGLALLLIAQWVSWLKGHFRLVKNSQLLLSGLIAGLMPLAHTHSFLVLLFAGIFFLIWDWSHWKKWFLIALGAGLAFSPIFFFFYFGQISVKFFSWQPGWLANKPPFWFNWLYFWLLNWGIFLPLTLFAAWKTRFYRQPIFGLGLFLFFLSNLFLFQPWDWDNSKILTFAYFFLALPIGIYLGQLLEGNFWQGILALVILEVLIFSGTLDLYRGIQTEKQKNLLWSNEEIALAEKFREFSWPGALVLTSDQHNNIIRSLTGAKTLMAYRGWLWSYGFNYAKVEKDIQTMYAGGEEGRNLLKKYGVDFVFIGPIEREYWQAQEDFFQTNYSKILDRSGYKIFQID